MRSFFEAVADAMTDASLEERWLVKSIGVRKGAIIESGKHGITLSCVLLVKRAAV